MTALTTLMTDKEALVRFIDRGDLGGRTLGDCAAALSISLTTMNGLLTGEIEFSKRLSNFLKRSENL